MENSVVVNTKQNLKAMLKQIKEQKEIVIKQKKMFKAQRKNTKIKKKDILKKTKEIEIRGNVRDALISSIEELMQTRIDQNVMLVKTEGDSSRYAKCIYKENGITLDEYITNLVTEHSSYFDSGNIEENKQLVLTKLHDEKILKQNYYPYTSSLIKGYFEEKPCCVFLDDKLDVSRVENKIYLTTEGINRFQFKELKDIYQSNN